MWLTHLGMHSTYTYTKTELVINTRTHTHIRVGLIARMRNLAHVLDQSTLPLSAPRAADKIQILRLLSVQSGHRLLTVKDVSVVYVRVCCRDWWRSKWTLFITVCFCFCRGIDLLLREEMGDFSPLREYFVTLGKAFVLCRRWRVNLQQSLRPMLWVNGAHVAERSDLWRVDPLVVETKDRYIKHIFLPCIFLSPFLQVGPACRSVTFYPELEVSSLDSNVETASCNWLTCIVLFLSSLCRLASPFIEIYTRSCCFFSSHARVFFLFFYLSLLKSVSGPHAFIEV